MRRVGEGESETGASPRALDVAVGKRDVDVREQRGDSEDGWWRREKQAHGQDWAENVVCNKYYIAWNDLLAGSVIINGGHGRKVQAILTFFLFVAAFLAT